MRYLLSVVLLLFGTHLMAQDYVAGKYGSDFLSVGGGSRALAMGSAHAAVANDLTAAYWNVAALTEIATIEGIYMHSERFNGIVNYDYGAVAIPLPEAGSIVAVSLFRQGVDGIKNTLDAWNEANGQPIPNPTDSFSEFSAYDLAFFVSYAQTMNEFSSWGTSFKIINSSIGPFANAWGYSIDLGYFEKHESYRWGIMIQDLTKLRKFWQVNKGNLKKLESFGDIVPDGQNESVNPNIKLGVAKDFIYKDFTLVSAVDLDLKYENRKAYFINWGKMSMEPHFGIEVGYKQSIYLRSGLTDVLIDDKNNYTSSVTLGAGFHIRNITIDYGLGSFTGISSELGYTHRISLKFTLND